MINSIRAYVRFFVKLPCDPSYQRIMHTVFNFGKIEFDHGLSNMDDVYGIITKYILVKSSLTQRYILIWLTGLK